MSWFLYSQDKVRLKTTLPSIFKASNLSYDYNPASMDSSQIVRAACCVAVKKHPDGMFNKAFLMSMNDGREVIVKVPNLNAVVPHYTTASEVATMDFARKTLDTPVPRVYAWNSQAKTHPMSAEFIIMDKVKGVLLFQVWGTMKLPQKLKVLLAITYLQKQWLRVSFFYYGSLYYAGDMQPSADSHYIKNSEVISDSDFMIGSATGRDWCDAG
ncbi:phosphotransferase enzyme family protein [Histoplasma capsulatum G186AR]|uniref:Altered inheritance of mitochondria protein 9, mitochondrial n=1 Tax=Ajellomyces capsulatus (strain G186AR / H82 / ATCC MYA-2454 / RMSCC 2432) TaxID=447093 RepID=C0P1D5_AJECG|nr:phosphotransferase enzyme family protein [Histoplasma capsulatum G186AR]EEH02544.1 phosphotransferase enzyme family protein [Histoplasma capsulatum G186AR]